MAEKIQKTRTGVNIILLVLLAGSIVTNVLLYNKEPDVKIEKEYITEDTQPLIDMRVKLENEVEITKNELEKYKGISAELDSMVVEANDKIKVKERKIRELSKNAKESKKLTDQLEAEIVELNRIKDEYFEKIDDLLMKNDELKSEYLVLDNTLENLQKELNILKKKVNIGEMLIADDIVVTPIKKNLLGKNTKTAMAKKTKRIDVCFDILPNKLARSDVHTAFMRIISPAGVVIFDNASGSGYTKNKDLGVDMMYTKDEDFNYKREKHNMCIIWDAPQDYKTGTYVVELYNEKNIMGISSFSLR